MHIFGYGYRNYHDYSKKVVTPNGRFMPVDRDSAQQLADAIDEQEPGEIVTLVIGVRRFIDAIACDVFTHLPDRNRHSLIIKYNEGIALCKSVWRGPQQFNVMITRDNRYQMRLLDFSDKPLAVLSY